MSKTISIIKTGTVRGVDSYSDPLNLQGGYVRHSVNLMFQSGRIMTRPAFDYMKLGLRGQFQGATMFRPSLGISFRPFGPCGSRLATAVNGKVFVNNAPETGVICDPMELQGPPGAICETDDLCSGDINLFQAENVLVVQGFRRNTMWWTGEGDLHVSPGMISDADQTPGDHSHDTFQDSKNKNFLINGAGVGIFWNGMVHQQGPYGVYVGDRIHKRGAMGTTDIVLMEEQSLEDPLSTNSRMGALLALEGVPQMGTANGEGQLIGYYDGGIVEYNTFFFPRKTLHDAEGKQLTNGWDTKQMVKHNCNVVSATGRYSVGVLPRDHFFRSGFGIHVLSRVLGVEFINDEPINVISDEVHNVLDDDDPSLLHGAAAGCWFEGHRWFMTTGFEQDQKVSSSPYGKGFVSWNKTWAKTADKTPVPAWEGVWTVDDGVAGIHRFIHTGMRDDRGAFGFLASDNDRNLWFAALRFDGSNDTRNGKSVAIDWALETGRFSFGDNTRTKAITDARFEAVFRTGGAVTVLIRSDANPVWQRWRTFNSIEKTLKPGERFLLSKVIGEPPKGLSEASWFEFRIEGTGSAEITGFDIDVSEGSGKMDLTSSKVIREAPDAYPLSTSI